MTSSLRVDGVGVEVYDDGSSLLDALREQLGIRSIKDGCSPQGQCGCCTVWIDGQPRVACVTPVRRVAGREVRTLDGLEPEVRDRWADAFARHGASQCGFCTPGIIMRLAALDGRTDGPLTAAQVTEALVAHLCRCTGWQTIVDAALDVSASPRSAAGAQARARDWAAAGRRATLEGGSPQRVGPSVALGKGGFADDLAPAGAWVAVPSIVAGRGRESDEAHGGAGGGMAGDEARTPGGEVPAGGLAVAGDGAARGEWAVGSTLAGARAAAAKIQGRRTTAGLTWPLDIPPGTWDLTLRTTWVEPAYLEPDASWCEPGGDATPPLANGGAFGSKTDAAVAGIARRLADEHGCAMRVVLAREDVVRLGPKRPPVAAGIRRDGTGVMRVVRTPGIVAAIASVAPGLVVEEVDVPGPPTSVGIRAAGWAEAAILLAGLRAPCSPGAPGAPGTPVATGAPRDSGGRAGANPPATAFVAAPNGSWATAAVGAGGEIHVVVSAGPVLDEVVLRSYCIGAAHQALGWVTSEAIAVGSNGVPEDLTIRSFGILRARDTPPITVEIAPPGAAYAGCPGTSGAGEAPRPRSSRAGTPDGPDSRAGPGHPGAPDPVNGSDAVFAAVAAAAWIARGLPPTWPTDRTRSA